MALSWKEIFKFALLRRGDSGASGAGVNLNKDEVQLEIGGGATGSSEGISIGYGSGVWGLFAVAVGQNAYAGGELSIAMGYGSDARHRSVAIGPRAQAYGWTGATAIGASVATYDGIAIGRDIQPTFNTYELNGTSIVIGVNNSLSAVNDVTIIVNNEAVTLNHAFLIVASNKLAATKVRLALIAGATQQTSYLTLQHVDQLTGSAIGRKISLTKLFALLDANGAETFDAFGEGTSDYGYYS